MRPAHRCMIVFCMMSLSAPVLAAQEQQEQYENLQVLPQGISRRALSRIMLENLRGLGLPRRQNQGCLYCHVGDMERPVDTWDFASDEKRTKRTARVMLAMVSEINGQYIASLDDRVAPGFRVSCYTCHAGRTDPRPLPDVLWAAYRTGGIDSAVGRYRSLRQRYLGADAYDFRVGVLSGVAIQMADSARYDDALALAALNVEFHPDARRALGTQIHLRLERIAVEQSVDDALTAYDTQRAAMPAMSIPGLLDGLGWRLYRRGSQEDALAVFRRNIELFPDQYIPNESLADALWFHGERETAIGMYEHWLERHPDHEMARRRLVNLRAGG